MDTIALPPRESERLVPLRMLPLCLLLILANLFLATPLRAEDDVARQLMLESGLVAQLNLLHKSLSSQLNYVIDQDPTLRQLSRQQKQHIIAWMRTSFAPDRLINSIHDYYYRSLSDRDMEQILRWIRSRTGHRFTEMEKSATGPYAEQEMQRYKQTHPLPTVPTYRLQQIKTLNKLTKVSDAALVVQLTFKLAAALIKQQPSPDKQTVDALMKEIGRQREDLMQKIMPNLIPDMLYMYRDASDLELQAYISFAQSSIGVRYHTTLLGAFNNALIEASQDFGHILLAGY